MAATIKDKMSTCTDDGRAENDPRNGNTVFGSYSILCYFFAVSTNAMKSSVGQKSDKKRPTKAQARDKVHGEEEPK